MNRVFAGVRYAGRSQTIAALFAGLVALTPGMAHAGPPFVTDDPEPVEYLHWELYLATQDQAVRGLVTGTAPHVEVNFGAAPDLQLHLIAPLAYARPEGAPIVYGPGDIEVGAKYRLVEEDDRFPMIGVFPLAELPAGSERRDLGTGHLHVFLPLWLQKSDGDWTTYGGGGYWFNPGPGNRDYGFAGWLLQRRFSKLATVGGELFYQTPDQAGGKADLRFNLGLMLDFTEHHHLLFSAGRSIDGDTLFQSYLAYQLTL